MHADPRPFLQSVFPIGALALTSGIANTDPLPSWNDQAAEKAIIAFVEKVKSRGSPGYVTPAERIATFDNDGTLWCEQSMYVQAFYVFDRIKKMAPQHPEWKTEEPFASVLKGNTQAALAGGETSLIALLTATHPGMTTAEFE